MGVDKLKIVVFGSYNAGKSTFIRAIDPDSRHIEADGENGSTTVALDFGRVTVADTRVFLFGTPGQYRFEFVRKILSRGMHGAIIIADSTVDIDQMTYSLCEWLSSQNVPFVVMLNKCDCEGSSPERFNDVVYDGFAHQISASTGENVYESLEAFVIRLKGLT